ncbi:MAG: glycerol-3-phosphate acyltransferase [Capsulimonadaceae bacterium]
MSLDAVLIAAASYLLGSVPVGLITGKIARGIDVRQFGSGNIGATNVWRVLSDPGLTAGGDVPGVPPGSNIWRTLGPVCGVLVMALDILKGYLPVLAAHRLHYGEQSWIPVVAGLAAIIGHNNSVFIGFKGGKGVATSLGVAIGLSWQAGAIGFGVWLVLLAITRYVSVSSIIAVPVCASLIWFLNGKSLPCGIFGALATIFAVYKHRANIGRLRAGTEPKVGARKTANNVAPAG